MMPELRDQTIALSWRPTSPWFRASCCRDGSLAAIQPLWVHKTSKVPSMFEGVVTAHTCARSTSSACTSLGRHCNTTLPSQSSLYGSVHPHFASKVHASVRASGIENERYCATACATCPVLVECDRAAYETVVFTKTGVRGGSVLMDLSWFQWSQRALAPAKDRKSGRDHLEFRLPCRSKMVQDCNRRFGTHRFDHVPNTSQWSWHRSGAGIQHSARSAKHQVGGTTLSLARSETRWKHARDVSRYLLT